jgi:hypothetical protein
VLDTPACAVCRTPLSLLEQRAGVVCARPSCGWTLRTLPANARCGECGRPLAARDRADGRCEGACRRAALHRARREREARAAGERLARAAALRDGSAAALGVAEPAAYPVTVIPSADAPATPLPKRRRRALRAHLARIIAEAVARGAPTGPPDPGPPAAPPPAPDLAAVLGGACAQCRGACCAQGGEHAYLTAERMQHYLAAHPTQSAEDALEAYAGRVADVTARRSCVYHGTAGCTLPREMRADVCNRHYCEALWRFRADLDDGVPPRAFFAAVDGEGRPRRGAFVDAREVRVARRGRAPGPA